jgi:hypothetical protein
LAGSPADGEPDGDAEIFVALAAYREPELGLTIESCLDNASHADRLRFGVCLQWDDTIIGAGFNCLDRLQDRCPIRLVRYHYTESRGGCWARHLTQGLYDGERYTLQIDAHSRLGRGWDEECVTTLRALPGDRPLLTGSPPLYRRDDGVDTLVESADAPVPITVVEHWDADGWIHHPVVPAPDSAPRRPRPTRVLSGGFVFTSGAWNIDVRQDPEYLYGGEEFALTLRSFTSGYDLWNPGRRLVWHRLHPAPNPKFISDNPDAVVRRRHERACRRLRTLLAGDPDHILDPYSLGTVRTLKHYADWSGLDIATRRIHPDARNGLDPPLPSP